MMTVNYRVGGMSCAGCASSIIRRLSAVNGVYHAHVDHLAGTAVVTFDETMVTPGTLEAIMDAMGFDADQCGLADDACEPGPDETA